MTTAVLKNIITGSPAPNLFSGAYMARHLLPSDFPTVQISTNRDVEAELRDIGMEKLNKNVGGTPAKPPSHETRTALHAGSMSANEAADFCKALANRNGEVKKPVFRPDSGILKRQQPLPKPVPVPTPQPAQKPPQEPEPLPKPTVAASPEEPQFPKTIRVVESQSEQQQQQEDESQWIDMTEKKKREAAAESAKPPEPSSPEPPEMSLGSPAPEQQDQPVNSEPAADNAKKPEEPELEWVDMSAKKQREAESAEVEDEGSSSDSSSDNESVEDDSLVADEEEDEESGDEVDEAGSESEGEEDASDEDEEDEEEEDEDEQSASSDEDGESSSESSDEAPVQIEERPKHRKRKIPERSSRTKRQKTYEEEYAEDLVDDGHGRLVPRGKAKGKQAKGRGKTPAPTAQLSSFVGRAVSTGPAKRAAPTTAKQSKPKRRYTPTTEPMAYDDLCNSVTVEKFYNSPIYAHFREFWENMTWLASHDALGRTEERQHFPHNSKFASFIREKVNQTISKDSHWLHRALFACEKMDVGLLPGGVYRIKLHSPRKDSADIYPHDRVRIYCDDPIEYTAYIRAYQALRPARYVHNMMLQECNSTKNMPGIGGEPRKLYEHTRTNQRLLDTAFIDWVNMALLSRFDIIDVVD
jgi:hypothetical protein